MPSNTLHHDKTLAALNTEVKYAKWDRHWSRYGRNGECSSSRWAAKATRAYNRATRKASRVQLSRYQTPVEEPTQYDFDQEYYVWEDDRYQSDMDWTISDEERRFNDHFWV